MKLKSRVMAKHYRNNFLVIDTLFILLFNTYTEKTYQKIRMTVNCYVGR